MKPTWHILKSPDENFVRQAALAKGWMEDKVQVRKVRDRGVTWFLLEPFEENCRCPGIIPKPHPLAIEAMKSAGILDPQFGENED